MAPVLATVFFGLTALAGVVLGALGYYAYRNWDEPGVYMFAAFTLVLGIGAVVGGALGFGTENLFPEGETTNWSFAMSVGYVLSAVPWLLFSLQHTGRTTRLRRVHALLLVPTVAGIVSWSLLFAEVVPEDTLWTVLFTVTSGITLSIYSLGLVIFGSLLHLRAAWEYGHISLVRGVTLAVTPLVPLVLQFVSSSWGRAVGESSGVAFTFLGYAIPVATLSIAMFYYDTFAATPAVGSIGRRQVARQMDDPVVVTDHWERVIELNRATVETFDVSESERLGDPLEALLGTDIDTLRASEEISLHTVEGHRQFDVQVSEITDQHDRWLGFLVTLHDVTRREIREQRLQVLNRILRHNLRNKLTVVKAQAEAVEDDEIPQPDEEVSHRIQSAADELLELSERAKEVERLMHDGTQDSMPFSLERAVEDVVEEVHSRYTSVDVCSTVERDLVVYADEALFVHTLYNVVDNAARYNDANNPSVSVTVSVHPNNPHQVVVEVADNGPGIPSHELEVIREGRETDLDHASGLGLWATNWGVKHFGGELTFLDNEPRGTIVRIELPTAIFGEEKADSRTPDHGVDRVVESN